MSKKLSKKLSAILDKPAKVKHRTRVGRYLAVEFYNEKEELMDLDFIDNIDICRSHTIFCFNKGHLEVYPFRPIASDTHKGIISVWYENNTSIKIMRIS